MLGGICLFIQASYSISACPKTLATGNLELSGTDCVYDATDTPWIFFLNGGQWLRMSRIYVHDAKVDGYANGAFVRASGLNGHCHVNDSIFERMCGKSALFLVHTDAQYTWTLLNVNFTDIKFDWGSIVFSVYVSTNYFQSGGWPAETKDYGMKWIVRLCWFTNSYSNSRSTPCKGLFAGSFPQWEFEDCHFSDFSVNYTNSSYAEPGAVFYITPDSSLDM
jgi:hypothetical protein